MWLNHRGMSMRDNVEELRRRRAEALRMGGELRLQRQRERGKLDARARLDLLLDPGSFHEIGLLATHLGKLDTDPPSPADGVICGTGFIEGRPACVASYDFTVHGGSIGPVGERKVARLRELALRERIPMIWLVDSAGARLSAAARCTPRSPAAPIWRRPTTPLASPPCASTSPTFRSAAARSLRGGPPQIPRNGARRRCWTSSPTTRGRRTTCTGWSRRSSTR